MRGGARKPVIPSFDGGISRRVSQLCQNGGQVFVSTHSPDFLNALELNEVCWLVKKQGFTQIHRAKDNAQIAAYVAEGDQLGYLWKQDFFDGVSPE